MERPVRIAVVGPVPDQLVTDIQQLPLRPEVRVSSSLVADSEAVLVFHPEVLVLGLGGAPDEEVGAVRLLRQLWPTLGVVVATSADQEVTQAQLAARLRAPLLIYPDQPGQLAAVLEQARLQSDRPRADTFVDLARGIADEINNPLLFVAGHLQLLRASLQGPERDRRDQVAAALAGVGRIEASVERLRLLSQAANGPRARQAVDLGALAAAALQARPRDPGKARIVIGEGAQVVEGDREQLATAIDALVQFADEVATAGAEVELRVHSAGTARHLHVLARGPSIASWQLPQTFEPYYPSRALRGQSAGLGLFLVQTVVLGHRGQATARRAPDGALELDFALPT